MRMLWITVARMLARIAFKIRNEIKTITHSIHLLTPLMTVHTTKRLLLFLGHASDPQFDVRRLRACHLLFDLPVASIRRKTPNSSSSVCIVTRAYTYDSTCIAAADSTTRYSWRQWCGNGRLTLLPLLPCDAGIEDVEASAVTVFMIPYSSDRRKNKHYATTSLEDLRKRTMHCSSWSNSWHISS